MPNITIESITSAIHDASGLYHRMVLLVGESNSGKTRLLREVAHYFGTDVVNVNLMMAEALLTLTPRQRQVHLLDILEELVLGQTVPGSQQTAPVVLDNLELLFDRHLAQNPLTLLCSISRNNLILASWNGSFRDSRLLYAEPGHPEYRCYDAADVLILPVPGESAR